MTWKKGQELQNGKYTIVERIGGGGFGVTYRATSKNRQRVVIKTLNALRYNDESEFEQQQVKFVNEALSLAKCKHPQVVEVYEVVREGELWGMVMEYIDGKDLAKHLENRGLFSEAEALPIIRQVGEALTYIHSLGFLHRDVKPANIVLRRDTGQAVLIDFGLAREYIDNRTLTQTNQVTYGFAPIEQYKPRAQRGAFTDVYALAATLYNLLTNQVPFPANFREQNVPLIPPQQHNPQISNRINQAILQGMELHPQDRPQSVAEFLQLLFPPTILARYQKLQDLLAAGKWEDADAETFHLMCQVAGLEELDSFTVEDLENFPCEDLRVIDKLWVKYSQMRFGFSVQKRIWLEEGGKVDWETECRLGDRVGWRVKEKWLDYRNLTFGLTAPTGHLPKGGGFSREGGLHFFGFYFWARKIGNESDGEWDVVASSLAHKCVKCSI